MAHLNINRHLTAPSKITRGVLQGNPLLPYLFVLQTVLMTYMMKPLRNTDGTPLSSGNVAPPATFFCR